MRAINELYPKPLVDDPVTSYATHNEEMVKRAMIVAAGNSLVTEEDGPFNDSFVANIGKLWDLICPIVIKTEACTHIKCARTMRDRRKAMMALHDHFMVTKNVNHIQKQT